MKKRIVIVGHFGGDEFFTDGQTVKVRSFYECLVLHYPGIIIDKVDTYYVTRKPFKFITDFLIYLFRNKKIIIFPAARGRRYMFMLFYYLCLLLNKEVYHDCIAGSLDIEIKDNPNWIKYLNKFKVNWMESPEQVAKLKQMGINNAIYLPNFKRIERISLEEIRTIKYNKPYKFCTFSRVEPQKGLGDALDMIQDINNINGHIAELDIYGPIQPGYESWFESIQEKYRGIINYKGIVDPHNSVEILKNYFALLFPTQYFTEGMPGTIIDAMFAGIPVIARKWAWCDNMIKSYYNGISYDFDKPELLKDILLMAINTPNMILSMKENCLNEAEKYSDKIIIETIYKSLFL